MAAVLRPVALNLIDNYSAEARRVIDILVGVRQKDQYAPYQFTREETDKRIQEFLQAKFNLNQLRAANSLRYQFHLIRMGGLVSLTPGYCNLGEARQICKYQQVQDMEGWQPRDFFPLRISFLFRQAARLLNNEVRLHCPVEVAVGAIIREITVNTHTYFCMTQTEAFIKEREDEKSRIHASFTSLFPSSEHLRTTLKTLPQQLSEIQDNFEGSLFQLAQQEVLNVSQLKPNQELSYRTGSKTHCVYVAFRREIDDNLSIRIDNAGLWASPKLGRNHGGETITVCTPHMVAWFPFEQLNNLPSRQKNVQDYLFNLFLACNMESAEARLLIYDQKHPSCFQREPNLQERFEKFLVQEPPQNIGNCVLNSHNMSVRQRWQWDRDLKGFNLFKHLYDIEIAASALTDPYTARL